ncbi:hypothetical protein KI387_021182 [Taxus chinensis]|uniref:Uncharacterized protein n=1 Tax=Taxus chinensis TaxID=29808 RepID=A0AA38LBX7_TAXCH|nr:hypothetical protein KI387_021182 [Taxus chinensis]
MAISNDYSVEVVKKEFIVPDLPMQEHVLHLSNIDLTLSVVMVHVFFCYENSSQTSFAAVLSNLKRSLSQAIVPYYVFGGRLVTNGVGYPEMLCNNKGAEFAEAHAAIPLCQVEFCDPMAAVKGKLIPLLPKDSYGNGTPVFSVQVTKFSCGGIVVGCTFDHRIADSFSANLFFTCWAKISRNESILSVTPSFTRSILVPRYPPSCCPGIEQMYTKITPIGSIQQTPQLASRIYYLSVKDIEKLQLSANELGNSYSKLEAFSAYLWKLFIQGQGIKDTINCNICIALDGRSRLQKIGMPANYFGNVLLLPFVGASAGDIKKQPLSWSAKLIHDAIHCAANEEYFQSLVDLVEMSKPSSVIPNIYLKRGEPAFVVSSGLRFPLYEVDHGWGKPNLASYYVPYAKGYVMPTRSSNGDGSWIIYMNLLVEQLKALESHPNFILRPITQKFLAGQNIV